MLARSVVARVAADVHKTTHELSRTTHIIRNRFISRNGLIIPTFTGRTRAHRTIVLPYRRSYATEARATKPTAKVTRDVKKAAASKPSAKTTPKKKTGTTATTKKAATKRAKPAAKPKRVVKKKKQLTPEEKEKEVIRELKKKALKPPCQPSYRTGVYAMFYRENFKKDGTSIVEQAKELGAKYKALTPAEMEHYTHLANERTAAGRAEYKAWVLQYTPEQIGAANIARAALRRKLNSSRWIKLVDERIPRRPQTAYIRFSLERRASGDFKHVRSADASKLLGEEWHSLSAAEKKKYQDEAQAGREEYQRKHGKTSA